MNISDEAVEAAAAAIQVRFDKTMGLNALARAGLEAVAPHLMARSFEEGSGLGYSDCVWQKGHEPRARNPYRSSGAGE